MKIFLTGGTGFIGQPLTKSLLANGWDVTVLVRNPDAPQARIIKKFGATLVQGDATDRESMRAAMTGADVVIHNCGHYELGVTAAGQERMVAVNVQGTKNVLGLAHELSVSRTIYISTVFAYGDSGPELRDETFVPDKPGNSTYEITKKEAHRIANSYQSQGMPLTIICPNGVIGPGDHSHIGHFLRLYLNKIMPPVAWSPDSIYTLVDLQDLTLGITLAVEKGKVGETYFLCGEPISLREMFQMWGRKPGAFPPKLWLPAKLAAVVMAPIAPLLRALGLPAFMSPELVMATSGNLNYSSVKAQRELGWMHKSAEKMWADVIDKELAYIAKNRDENLLFRLKSYTPSAL